MPSKAYSVSTVFVEAPLMEKLMILGQKSGSELSTILLAAWILVVSRLSAQDAVIIGVFRKEFKGFTGHALPMHVEPSGVISTLQLIDRVNRTLSSGISPSSIVDEESASKERSLPPQAAFYMHDEDLAFPTADNVSVRCDLELHLVQDKTILALGIRRASDLYNEGAIERYAGYFRTVLMHMTADSSQSVDSFDILSPEEKRLLDTWNQTDAEYPDRCIHHFFEEQVENSPEAVAVVHNEQKFTYAELHLLASRFAFQLLETGVKRGDSVAMLLERSVELVATQLAVLKIGAAYVPIDPRAPLERQAFILKDSGAVLLVTNTNTKIPSTLELPVHRLDISMLQATDTIELEACASGSSSDTAYVMYTSGSTGIPKAVVVPHRAIACRVFTNGFADIGSSDRVAFATNPSHVPSTFDIWATFLRGARMVILDNDIVLDPHRLAAALVYHQVTSLYMTNPLLQQYAFIIGDALSTLKYLIGGADLGTTKAYSAVLKHGGPVRMVHRFGSTETPLGATAYTPSSNVDQLDHLPIGRPVPNIRCYVLDRRLMPAPIGVIGELYVGGSGVATRYLNRPDITAERFLPDPFSNVPGAYMYKTGDMVRYLPDGNLVFMGRNDFQVKIRGYRIELGEIESRLVSHRLVKNAAVLGVGDEDGKRLVAYVAADPDQHLTDKLHEYLALSLPEYMIPAAFVQLDELPLTIRGKVDRSALPIYDFASVAQSQEDYSPPQGDMEMMLAALWSELLKVERVGRSSNFFMLGGHSLIAIRMIERLRRLGYTMSVRTLFETPVLHTLASSLRQHQSSPAAPPNTITPTSTSLTPDMLPLISLTQGDIDNLVNQVPGGVANIQDIYALSPLQEGILFHHMMAMEADPYLITVCAAFRNRELLDHYLRAYQKVVDRHDILRTAILWENMSTPAQTVLRHVPLPVTEHSLVLNDGPVVSQLMRLYDPRKYRLNLNTAPLIRLATAQDTDGRWILLELHHHIIGDRSTTEVLQEEIRDILAGGFERLPAPEPYRNLIAEARLRGVSVGEQEAFFSRMLQDIEIPSLLYGLTNIYSDGCDVTDSHCTLPQDLNNKLRGHARRLGVSLASLCHLAWARVVGSLSGQDQVVFGTVLFGRMQGGAGSDRALGLFVNTLPFRVDVGETSVQESLRKVQTDLAALLQHEHASLAHAQRQSGVPMGMPLFNALLNYRHNTAPDQETRATSGIETIATLDRTNYPFTISVEDYGSSLPSSLGLAVQVVQPYDPARICSYMQQALENLAQALESNPQTPVHAVGTLPADEHDLLIHEWNNTETPYPSNFCVHQLFENQAKSSPEVIAIVHKDRSMTYSRLNAHGNSIARQLAAAGVKAGDHVAIMLDRSIEHVAVQLAILKAGAAYVPIDTKAPVERQTYIASDSGVKLLLTDEKTVVPAQIEVPVLRLGANVDFTEDTDIFDSAHTSTSSTDTAYIMYTSGSTGRPKGVMVPHRGISRLFFNNALATIGPGDCMAFASNPAFDQSVYEIWAPLLTGARLVVIDHDTLLDPHRLAEALVRHEVTFLRLTNAVIQQYAGIIGRTMSKLRYLIGAGEQGSLKGYSAIVEHGGSVCLINSLGTTETTVDATMYVATSAINQLDRLPIGRPISNTRLYVLDKNRKPVPLGVTGELYIGGPGVANGYLNRPDLTAERFLPDPFSNAPGARMYKTGDLARWLPDGNLIYLGRDDFQVKIRGFRIELGEIEERLSEHPQVHEAVVVAAGEGGDKRLVAYIAAAADDKLATSLRDHLASILPEYMIPSAFVRMDVFPLNNNGKVDRRALPDPDGSSFVTNEYADPEGDIECALVEIWTELLKIERVGRHDNFFALGGHSLLAVRLMNRLSTTLGVQLSLSTLYQKPTLSDLAEVLSNSVAQEDMSHLTISRVNREGPLELSFAQQRLWFLAQMDGVSEIYHVPMALRLHGTLDKDALQKALNSLFVRHEALRTVFVSTNGQPNVQLLPANSGWALAYDDLRAEKDKEASFEHLKAQEVSMPFDLEKGPLVRALLIQLSEKKQALLFTLHHIIVDGWSLGVLFRDLSDLYAAYCSGIPNSLAPLSIQYPDYAAWQRQWLTEDRLEDQAAYWRNTLAGAPVTLTLPTDRPRPRQQSFAGGFVPIRLDAQLTSALHTLCQKHGVTMFMTILAAWSAVLSRLSGQDDVVIGTPVANRNHPQVEQLIGFFVNTLALRIDLSGEPKAEQILDRVRKTTIAAQAHQDMPFEQVVEIVQPPRRMDQTPIFQVLLAWQNSDIDSLQLQGVEAVPDRVRYDIAKFDQELFIGEENGEITGSLRYSTALFDHQTIERHVGYLEAMLRWMTGTTQQTIEEAPILGSPEQKLLLETWNDTHRPYPDSACIHHLFEIQARSSPEAIAIVQDDRSMTYRELDSRANRIAHQLVTAGVQSGEHVAILLERSIDLVASQIAILKVGAAYVPIDTKAPVERKAYMVADSGARLLVTDEAILIPDQIKAAVLRLGKNVAENVQDDIVAHVPASIDTEAPALLLGLNVADDVQDRFDSHYVSKSSIDTAYVMYTSGSTGLPKGVMVSHRGVARLTINNGWFDIGPGDRVAFGSNTTFDLSTLDVWTPLLNGGCIVVFDQDTVLNAHQLEVALERHQVNALQLPTAIFHQYAFVIGSALSRLKYLLFAGEQGLIEACTEVLRHGGPVRLINAYGPTETVYTTWYVVTDAVSLLDRLPIGKPINNTQLYVLDKHRNPVPVGVVGELYVAGPGVANGYLNRPDLTTERFLPDAFSNEPHARMYRTGDLVRYLPDGNVVYIGRTDFQVKVRGFRIEIGEIEARLAEHPRVREVVVLAAGEIGDKRLVAYVVASPFDNFVSTLREYLTASLPEYMVPSAFVRMDVMPLTNNGKADRRALPEPSSDSFVTETYVAPEGEIEETMAGLWAAVLKVDRVGRYDNFFMLGGHSLLVVRLMNRLSTTLGVQLSLSTIFQSPTLSGLAEEIKNHNARDDLLHSIIYPAERDGMLELSFAQQRLWFLAQMDGVSETYRVPVARRLRGNLNQKVLQQALDSLFARHESLRSVFVSVNDEPKVLLLPVDSGLPLLFHDLRNEQDKVTLAKRLTSQEAAAPFELEKGPLVRAQLIQIADDEHIFLLTMHHITTDGWSMGVLFRELNELYMAYIKCQPNPLTPLSIQYPDYAAWQRGQFTEDRLEDQAAYWRNTLAGAPVTLTLPTDRPRPRQQSFAGGFIPIRLDAQLTSALHNLCQKHGVTMFMAILAAWSAVLSRLSGQDDVVIGTPVANRNHPQVEQLIGFFVNTLALRIDLSGEPKAEQILNRVRKTTIAAQAHQDMPFEQVVEIVQPPRRMDQTPIFQVMFAWQNNELGTLQLQDVEATSESTQYDLAKFDLSLEMHEENGEIIGGMQYATALLDHQTIERHIGYLKAMLRWMTVNTEGSIDQAPILEPSERKLLIHTWNATDRPYPDNTCIHRIFESQVKVSPDAIAIVHADRSVTYRELNSRASRIARQLAAAGVNTGDHVLILLDRSVELVAVEIAVLKAGAVYVPLDPHAPVERQVYIATDCAAKLVVTDERTNISSKMQLPQLRLSSNEENLDSVPDLIESTTSTSSSSHGTNSPSEIQLPQLPLCSKEENFDSIQDLVDSNSCTSVSSCDTAYVMYTSGSTGLPKGVMVSHRGVARLAFNNGFADFASEDRVAFSSNPSFDPSTFEVWAPLLNGARIVIIDRETFLDPHCLAEALLHHQVTFLHMTNALLHQYAFIIGEPLSQLRYLTGAAEQGSIEAYNAVLQHGGPVRVINRYGPTEATVDVTAYTATSCLSNMERLPIGQPVGNTRVYVLDKYLVPVPIGAAGELYIGGPGVANGYLNRPELTAERFLLDPFSNAPGARMYKTGDLVRYLSDGELVFLGRRDNQIKIRGYQWS
ncbi:MAG: hypothetical protein BYD32DRAFT_460189 [Podila humilis]|nr:MAG: hypothetical protein BYD32DRAFT_460189 [Podila humilis]